MFFLNYLLVFAVAGIHAGPRNFPPSNFPPLLFFKHKSSFKGSQQKHLQSVRLVRKLMVVTKHKLNTD